MPNTEPGRLCQTGEDDRALVAACRAGDTAAFGQIVERYQRVVVAVAYAAVRDRELAADVAQDAFVTAWRKLVGDSGPRDDAKLPAWLCGIARNLARARMRTRGREVAEVNVAGELTPYAQLDDAQREAAVAAALARVPETYREPLVLFYCEQQSAGQVARALGVSDAAVHQRLSRGRAMLAADAELVEHAPSRGRRDLAAAVLAAIALGVGSSSRVSASPHTRGPSMLKLAAVALTASLAAGTTYVVAHTSSATPTSHAQAHVQPPGAIAYASSAPSRPALGPTGATCADLGMHMAHLALDNANDLPPPGAVRDQVYSGAASQFEQDCFARGFSTEYIACALGSPDFYSTMLDCAAYMTPDMAVDPAKPSPGMIVVMPRTDRVASITDTSCAAIARHATELTEPDPASIANAPADRREQLKEGLAKARAEMPAQMEKACADTAWPQTRRSCIAAATTAAELSHCE